MKASRVGFNRCSGRKLPSGSHQASARAAKRPISSGSTVALFSRTISVLPAEWFGIRPSNAESVSGAAQKSPAGRRDFETSMARIVQKFGGTSVADVERLKNVARRVKCEVDAGNEVAVVVSAMAGTTNQLIDW